uniref:Uncharacterized protein n=1 Tax=Nelumbo nucifera TaxID=4432 RepID=A0A822YAX2_NELNU|nr:TPA_asm: hypothetical protein HUJ06_030741 [Nelumbo nucifera]
MQFSSPYAIGMGTKHYRFVSLSVLHANLCFNGGNFQPDA